MAESGGEPDEEFNIDPARPPFDRSSRRRRLLGLIIGDNTLIEKAAMSQSAAITYPKSRLYIENTF
jgi:hypothetical protein